MRIKAGEQLLAEIKPVKLADKRRYKAMKPVTVPSIQNKKQLPPQR